MGHQFGGTPSGAYLEGIHQIAALIQGLSPSEQRTGTIA